MAKFNSETAKYYGSRGGKRSKRGKLPAAMRELRDLAQTIFRDLDVQNKLYEQARSGTLPPNVLALLAAHGFGKVPQTIKVERPTATSEELRERVRALSPSERGRYGDALRVVAAVQEGRPLPPLVLDGSSGQGGSAAARPQALPPRSEAIGREDDWQSPAALLREDGDEAALARIAEMNTPPDLDAGRSGDLPQDDYMPPARPQNRRARPDAAA